MPFEQDQTTNEGASSEAPSKPPLTIEEAPAEEATGQFEGEDEINLEPGALVRIPLTDASMDQMKSFCKQAGLQPRAEALRDIGEMKSFLELHGFSHGILMARKMADYHSHSTASDSSALEDFDPDNERWVKIMYQDDQLGSSGKAAIFVNYNGESLYIPRGQKLCIRERFAYLANVEEMRRESNYDEKGGMTKMLHETKKRPVKLYPAHFYGFAGRVLDGDPDVDPNEFAIIGKRPADRDQAAAVAGR